jgi:hypothetical protein
MDVIVQLVIFLPSRIAYNSVNIKTCVTTLLLVWVCHGCIYHDICLGVIWMTEENLEQ